MTEQFVKYIVIKHRDSLPNIPMDYDDVRYLSSKEELNTLIENLGSEVLDFKIYEVSKEIKLKVVVA